MREEYVEIVVSCLDKFMQDTDGLKVIHRMCTRKEIEIDSINDKLLYLTLENLTKHYEYHSHSVRLRVDASGRTFLYWFEDESDTDFRKRITEEHVKLEEE